MQRPAALLVPTGASVSRSSRTIVPSWYIASLMAHIRWLMTGLRRTATHASWPRSARADTPPCSSCRSCTPGTSCPSGTWVAVSVVKRRVRGPRPRGRVWIGLELAVPALPPRRAGVLGDAHAARRGAKASGPPPGQLRHEVTAVAGLGVERHRAPIAREGGAAARQRGAPQVHAAGLRAQVIGAVARPAGAHVRGARRARPRGEPRLPQRWRELAAVARLDPLERRALPARRLDVIRVEEVRGVAQRAPSPPGVDREHQRLVRAVRPQGAAERSGDLGHVRHPADPVGDRGGVGLVGVEAGRAGDRNERGEDTGGHGRNAVPYHVEAHPRGGASDYRNTNFRTSSEIMNSSLSRTFSFWILTPSRQTPFAEPRSSM